MSTPRGGSPIDLGPIGSSARRRSPASNRSGIIVLVVAVLLALLVASTAVALLHRSVTTPSAPSASPAKRVVMIVVDGLSPRWIGSAHMPNLRSLVSHGRTYQNAWIGQIPAVTPASAATIGTGDFPSVDGVVGIVWQDSLARNVVRATDPEAVRLGALDQVMELQPVVPVAASLKNRFPRARILAVAGTNCAAADAAGTWLADYVLCIARRGHNWEPSAVVGHSLPANATPTWKVAVPPQIGVAPLIEGWRLGEEDDRITSSALVAMDATHPALAIVDYPEFASLAPFLSPSVRRVTLDSVLHRLDVDIGRVVAHLRRKGQWAGTTLIVTSGEAFVPSTHSIPRSTFDSAVVAAGGTARYLSGGSIAAIGLRDPLQAQPVAQALQQQTVRGVAAIYYRTGGAGHWRYQPQYLSTTLSPRTAASFKALLATMAASTSADVVALTRPGIRVGPPRVRGYRVGETSGGVDWATEHIPLIVSGHGVLPGTSSYPARMVDLAPTVLAALGIGSHSGDGVTLADGLAGATSVEIARQHAQLSRLRANVAGIRRFGGG